MTGIAGDTICAIATPSGIGGIGIVRVSGPAAPRIARAILQGEPRPRHAHFAQFTDGDGRLIDSGIALYFPAPHSFTGEHVLELQAHGGPVILNMLMQRLTALGARMARPGEFSERAFLNDKLDLAQAEAIADLIESGTEAAARAAQRSLQGEFSERVRAILDGLTETRVYVEAAIDFPDEEVDFLEDSDLLVRLDGTLDAVTELQRMAHQGQLLKDGFMLAIIGRPNAGKSSLLNALTGRDSAIVTDIPGTTRDLLREQVNMDGLPIHLVDTAGIHESDDRVEAEGVRRARDALRQADLVLLVVDTTAEIVHQMALKDEIPPGITTLTVFNKADLSDEPARADCEMGEAWISAKTGAGLDALKSLIRMQVGFSGDTEGSFTARSRHLDALARVAAHIEEGRSQLAERRAGELLAEELRLAQQALGEITGEYSTEDLLGAIFSSFCIGK